MQRLVRDAVIEPLLAGERFAQYQRQRREARATYRDRMIFLTANSFSSPLLTGYFPALPFQDVFAETITHEDFKVLSDRIERDAPDIVLVDDPKSSLAGYPEQRAFFGRLMGELSSSYLSTGSKQGWEIWKRRRL